MTIKSIWNGLVVIISFGHNKVKINSEGDCPIGEKWCKVAVNAVL